MAATGRTSLGFDVRSSDMTAELSAQLPHRGRNPEANVTSDTAALVPSGSAAGQRTEFDVLIVEDDAVDAFLTRAHRSGHRCVLIIHGRGLNSKDQIPVLKSRVTTWLRRGTWARWVLAFTSARPCDGGAGALYVLLRRRRDAKHSIRVTEGAKW